MCFAIALRLWRNPPCSEDLFNQERTEATFYAQLDQFASRKEGSMDNSTALTTLTALFS